MVGVRLMRLPMPSPPGAPGLRPRLRRIGHIVLVVVLALGPVLGRGPVFAAEEPARPKLTETQKQEVRDRYDKATRFYYLRKYPEAITEYEAIYLLSADPVMLYNIAQCHRQADQPEQAVQFYKNYLRNAPNATNRADVEKKITEMERLADDRRRLQPPAAAIPGGAPAPVQPPAVIPGAGVVPAPVSPDASTLPPPPPPPGVASGEGGAVAVGAEAPAPRSRFWPVTLMVGGGVFVATSVVLGAVASSKARSVETAAKGRQSVFDSKLQDSETAGKSASGLAVLTGLVGAGALGTGIYLWISGRKAAETARAPIVTPVLGVGYAGASARVSF
jgi:hypothetical protein